MVLHWKSNPGKEVAVYTRCVQGLTLRSDGGAWYSAVTALLTYMPL